MKTISLKKSGITKHIVTTKESYDKNGMLHVGNLHIDIDHIVSITEPICEKALESVISRTFSIMTTVGEIKISMNLGIPDFADTPNGRIMTLLDGTLMVDPKIPSNLESKMKSLPEDNNIDKFFDLILKLKVNHKRL